MGFYAGFSKCGSGVMFYVTGASGVMLPHVSMLPSAVDVRAVLLFMFYLI